MSLAAGKLRHKGALQALSRTRDSEGAVSEDWATVASVWAALEPLSGREFVQSGAGQSQVSARVTIRYRAGVTAGMRWLYRNTAYNIEAVLPDKESGIEYLTLMVSTGVNAG